MIPIDKIVTVNVDINSLRPKPNLLEWRMVSSRHFEAEDGYSFYKAKMTGIRWRLWVSGYQPDLWFERFKDLRLCVEWTRGAVQAEWVNHKPYTSEFKVT